MYVRVEGEKNLILPSEGTNSEEYLAQVRRELDSIIAKGAPGARHLIELENGQRGGWFARSELAMTELLTELVDASHSTASKKNLTEV